MGPLGVALNAITGALGGTPVQAASNVFNAVCNEELSGRRFVFLEKEREAKLSELAQDDEQARELWSASERLNRTLPNDH